MTLGRLLAAACLTLSAGCADEAGQTSAEPAKGTPTSSPATETAQSVTVTASGGLTGERVVRRVKAGDALADEVLPLTGDRSVFAGLAAIEPPPCCDHVSYRVVVDYARGPDYSFVTWNGADVPPEVDRLVAATSG